MFQELARSDVKPGDLLDYVAAAYGQTPEDAAKGRRLAPITELFESGNRGCGLASGKAPPDVAK